MLTRYALHKLQGFERRFGYDATYMREILRVSPLAFLRVVRLQGMSSFRRGVAKEPWYAVKLVGALHEDCGPCAQLIVNMAKQENVPHAMLRAVVAGDEDSMTEDVRLAYQYARAVVSRASTNSFIAEIVRRWGQIGHLSLALALTSGRLYPMLKYALGHGLACTRVVVGEDHIALRTAASSAPVPHKQVSQ